MASAQRRLALTQKIVEHPLPRRRMRFRGLRDHAVKIEQACRHSDGKTDRMLVAWPAQRMIMRRVGGSESAPRRACYSVAKVRMIDTIAMSAVVNVSGA